MKAFLILFVIAIVGYSFSSLNFNHNRKNHTSSNLTRLGNDKYLSYDDSQIIFDTVYKNQAEVPIKLQSLNCPFEPYMLVVNDYKLILLNKNLNLIYTLKSDLKIQNAAWSPFNKSEIYLLAKKEFKIKKTERTKYLPETLFDLILYSLDLKSMQLTKIATLYDFSVRVCKLDQDPPEFFSASPFLKIDEANKLIYYDCLQPWNLKVIHIFF